MTDRTDGCHAAVLRMGRTAWSLLGVIGLTAVAALAVSAASAILVPLAVAVILGIVLEPVCRRLQRLGFPAVIATLTTLLMVVAVGAGGAAMVAWGFVQQWPEIYRQLLLGWSAMLEWATQLDLDTQWLGRLRPALEGHATDLGQGVLGAVVSTFYGALSLAMGVFLATFFLFFVLRDADRFPSWLARVTGLDPTEVDAVVTQTRSSVRGYFRGTAITAVLTAPIFLIPLLILGVPLALPILIVYFLLSFIPYLGAWITGAFVVLIALGSQGPTAALILGVCFVISNGTIQSVVSSWALGSSLRLHPVAVLLATMIGGTVAGLLGMVLGAPLVAATVRSTTAIRHLRSPGEARARLP